MPTLPLTELGIDGCQLEPQPMFGDRAGGVQHFLSGGEKNPQWFGGPILDVYMCFGTPGNPRGGHYHPKLQELFSTVSGTSLWVLSDFREDSPTKGKTAACIMGWNKPAETHGVPSHTFEEQGTLARLRVPNGVYHAVFALGNAPSLSVALGSTGFDKEDYRYPAAEEVPGMKALLDQFGLPLPPKK